MPVTRSLAGAAVLAAMTAAAYAQTDGQQPPAGDMPATPHQQQVLEPAAGGAEGQTQGGAAASGDPCATGMPATAHQAEALKTAQDCVEPGSGTTTGPDGVARSQPDGEPVQPQP
jgi:hypothetical protein